MHQLNLKFRISFRLWLSRSSVYWVFFLSLKCAKHIRMWIMKDEQETTIWWRFFTQHSSMWSPHRIQTQKCVRPEMCLVSKLKGNFKIYQRNLDHQKPRRLCDARRSLQTEFVFKNKRSLSFTKTGPMYGTSRTMGIKWLEIWGGS